MSTGQSLDSRRGISVSHNRLESPDENDRKPGRHMVPDISNAEFTKLSEFAGSARAMRPDPGDTMSFNTPRLFFTGWQFRHFTLADTSGAFNLWVETDELQNGNVATEDIDTFMTALVVETPAGSIDPSSGIVDNIESVFGPLPDVNGDAVLDILWYDIRDDYPSTDFFIESMVRIEDIDAASPDSVGNHRDVVYVDTNPLLTELGSTDVARTTAAVLQRFIHLVADADETTFIEVGLSDYSSILVGYEGGGNDYLLFGGEHNVPLFSWSSFVGDLQRASLFMNYIAEQLGSESLGVITADTANSYVPIESAIAVYGGGRTPGSFILDFHTANLVNDTSVDTRWGYSNEVQSNLRVQPTIVVDASLSNALQPLQVELAAGGVQYYSVENVADPEFMIDASDPAERDQLTGNFVGFGIDSTIVVEPLVPGSPTVLTGSFEQVVAVFTNTRIDSTSILTAIDGSWSGTAYPTTNVIYDDGTLLQSNPNFIALDHDFQQATFLPNPSGYVPFILDFSPFYINQFIDTSTGDPFGDPSDPRDFTLCIANEAAPGLPGDCFYEQSFFDPRAFEMLVTSDPVINFLTLDLFQFAEDLEEIGDMYMILSEAGTDDNVLVMSLSEYTVENVSYLYGPIGGTVDWYALWDLEFGDQPLVNRMVAARAQFQDRPVIVSVDPGIPEVDHFVLHQNYPNPFGQKTVFSFELDRPGRASLIVYDILGREVARIVDGSFPAGNHLVDFEPAGISSGVYLYRLTFGGKLQTGSMVYRK